MFSPSLMYAAACFMLILAYLNVGNVIWGGIRSNLTDDIQGLSMLEQERQGHMAMLLPKFTVILLWPAVAAFGFLVSIVSVLRTETGPVA